MVTNGANDYLQSDTREAGEDEGVTGKTKYPHVKVIVFLENS